MTCFGIPRLTTCLSFVQRSNPFWSTKHNYLRTRWTFDPLSIDILEGKVREGQTVQVDAKNGALLFREVIS